MAAEYVTREEHADAIARLDQADAELRNALTELERNQRADYESKIGRAVEDMRDAVRASRDDVKEDIGAVQAHLSTQDRAIGGAVLTFLVYLALHFVIHLHV